MSRSKKRKKRKKAAGARGPGGQSAANASEKLSERLLAFAGDFINSAEDFEDKQDLVNAACSAWNMACESPSRRERHLDYYMKQYCKYNPDATREHISNVRHDMEKLMAQKLHLFPNDQRQIVSARVTRLNRDQDYIEVASTPGRPRGE